VDYVRRGAAVDAASWVRSGLERSVALQIPTVLDLVSRLTAAGSPIRAIHTEWATGHDAWLALLPSLTEFGAVDTGVGGTFVPALSPVVRDAVLQAVDSLLAVSDPPFDNVLTAPTENVLRAAIWAIADIVASCFPTAHQKSRVTVEEGVTVPLEMTYQSAMEFVLRSWLGVDALIPFAHTGKPKENVDLCLRRLHPCPSAMIEFVCHERGQGSAPSSVASHITKLTGRYANGLPGFPDLWLINFDTVVGEAGKRDVLQAAKHCNRIHVVVSLTPFAVRSVMLWRVGSDVPVEMD
jgi:hypothetical protein